jgi:serine phosphatase RsbU (regulator of sigma subunit)
MAIAIIDPTGKELQYAGANRPLYLFRKKGEPTDTDLVRDPSKENEDYALYVIKGDNQPLGTHWDEREFNLHSIQLQEQDSFYLFSDGFVDQYGGKKRKKFKTRNFKKLLLSVQGEPMADQKEAMENAFDLWRGSHEQIDDVCVFGVKP